ncbi:hypothetical protein EXE58_14835 [Nocardioides seonyuensis]|uniref:Uncharacterized protein n=1 Tax=Nocardioides seonyuensis TaxID=2518371 RepID=A0A4P7IIN6_9ACTN|nr:hypothetical protein [Nocardioides seonyuensis]QBX56613.1 hypothetical protein EXE58_14835 [Nocardioides seonyuensis]
MSEMNQQDARITALRAVVDRVTSWQETATDGTIHEELDRGLQEAGVTLTDEQRDSVAQQISDGQEVDVEALAADSEAGGPA